MKFNLRKLLTAMFIGAAGLSLQAQIGNYNPNAGTLVLPPGGSGIATPGCFVPLPTQQSGTYYYTYTTSGTSLASSISMSATSSGSTMTNYAPSTPFYFNGNNIKMNVTLASNAQFCASQVINYTIYKWTGSNYATYCGYTLTVVCRDDSKDNFIVQSSGMYYAANDYTIDRQYWDATLGSWQYEDITPVGGWGGVQVDGWLASVDYNTDQIFFKGRDMKVYNIYKSGGNWYLGLLNASANNVAGCIRYRQDGLFYLGTDGKVYHLYWNSGWQFEAITPWSGWTATAYIGAINFSSGWAYTGDAMELADWPATNIYFRSTTNKIYNLVGSTGSWGLGQISPAGAVDCAGDMTTDNTGVYYRGTDNFVHRLYWGSSSWMYDAMPTSNLSTGNTEGHLSKFAGENRVFYRGTDGLLYNVYQNGSTWDVFPLDYSVNTIAGDVLCADGKVFFVSTDNRVHNFWWSGSAWVDNALTYSIANAKGCSRNYRLEAPETAPFATAAENTMKLYPNPAKATVHLQYENGAPMRYDIYTVTGQRIQSEQLNGDSSTGAQIDISGLSDGIYLLSAEFSDGHHETQRLIVQ